MPSLNQQNIDTINQHESRVTLRRGHRAAIKFNINICACSFPQDKVITSNKHYFKTQNGYDIKIIHNKNIETSRQNKYNCSCLYFHFQSLIFVNRL